MNKTQFGDMEHALSNGNRFYTEANDKNWNELVEKGLASKRSGWEGDMAYFSVTADGKEALKLTDFQLRMLKHCFGLVHSKRKPYRNYFPCTEINEDWEDLCAKGYATKNTQDTKVVYFGTLKGLREVYRRNVSAKYFEAI